MDGEDPNKHGERIKDAITRRIEIESLMRYHLYIDCLPTDRAPKLPDGILKVIIEKTLSTPHLVYTEAIFDKVSILIVTCFGNPQTYLGSLYGCITYSVSRP
jgi:hypothetical protein